MFERHAIKMAVCAVATVALVALAGCNGSNGNSGNEAENDAGGTEAATEEPAVEVEEYEVAPPQTGTQQGSASSFYTGTWRDPEYGDTLTFSSDGTATINQVGEGTTTWWWSETSSGILLENAANSYELMLIQQGGTYALYNEAKGLLFEKP